MALLLESTLCARTCWCYRQLLFVAHFLDGSYPQSQSNQLARLITPFSNMSSPCDHRFNQPPDSRDTQKAQSRTDEGGDWFVTDVIDYSSDDGKTAGCR